MVALEKRQTGDGFKLFDDIITLCDDGNFTWRSRINI